MKRKIRILGIGCISSLGHSKEMFWDSLANIDQSAKDSLVRSTIPNFALTDYIDERLTHKFDRNSSFAVAAAKLAISDSDQNLQDFQDREKGVFLGTSLSIATTMSDFDESVFVAGPRKCDIGLFPSTVMSAPASRIAILNSIKGINVTCCSGRNSGFDAIGYSFRELLFKNKKFILAGGSDALSDKLMVGFSRENFIIGKDKQPRKDSFVPSEGACIVALYADEANLHQKSPEIAAFNSGFSSYKQKDTSRRGERIESLIQAALLDANVTAKQIDAVIISNYFSKLDLEAELIAINRCFSIDELRRIPILSIKAITCETFSAFGGLQLLTALGLLNSKIDFIDKLNINEAYQGGRRNILSVLLTSVDSAGHSSVMLIKKGTRGKGEEI